MNQSDIQIDTILVKDIATNHTDMALNSERFVGDHNAGKHGGKIKLNR